MKKRNVAALAAVVAMMFASAGVAFAAQDKVEICHATSSDSKPYNSANASKTADAGGHDGHDGPIWSEGAEDWGDIIPPFTFDGGSYPGLNWTAQGQAIWNNDCVYIELADPTPTFDGGEADLTQAPTDTFGGNGTSTPADSAWLLVVALGVLLASVVVLTPARAKSRR